MSSTTSWRLSRPKWKHGPTSIPPNISWDCLKDNFAEVFKVFVDVLESPSFREDKIALAKDQINTAIARRNDQASGITAREAQKLVTARIRRTPASPSTRRSRRSHATIL